MRSILCPGARRERRRVVGVGLDEEGATQQSAAAMNTDVVGRAARKNQAVPEASLERCLLEIDELHPGVYPSTGRFKGDMRGFVESWPL